MKKLILNLLILLSINFAFAQTDLIKKKIIEKYSLTKFEVLEPLEASKINNFFIKIDDGNLQIYDNFIGALYPDKFKIIEESNVLSIAFNTNEKGEKEWLIIHNKDQYKYSNWNPIRISIDKYEKILLNDGTESPECIGIKGSEKTRFEVDLYNNKITDEQKIEFYGDANFLESGKTYFPFNHGRIIPVELDETKIINYQYTDDYIVGETTSIDPISGEEIMVQSFNPNYNKNILFDKVLWTNKIDKVIVKQNGYKCLYDFSKSKYVFENIDGYTEDLVYNINGVYLMSQNLFLPINIPNNLAIDKTNDNENEIISIKDKDQQEYKKSNNEINDDLIFSIFKTEINLTQKTVKNFTNNKVQTNSFDEIINKNKITEAEKLKIRSQLYLIDSTWIEPIFLDTLNIVKLKLYNERYEKIKAIKSKFFNFDSDLIYFQGVSVSQEMNINYKKIEEELVLEDGTFKSAVIFNHIYLNSTASLKANLDALNEIIQNFPKISELYYYRSMLNFYLKNYEAVINDIDKCASISPTIQNYIRKACLHFRIQNKKMSKEIVLENLDNAIKNIEKSNEKTDDHYLLYDLYWTKIRLSQFYKLPKKNICESIKQIDKLITDKLVSEDNLLNYEKDEREKLFEKCNCKKE
jgi:hypothetical protein